MTKPIKKSIDQILSTSVPVQQLNVRQQAKLKGGEDTIGIQDIVDG